MDNLLHIYFIECYDSNITGVKTYEEQIINILSSRNDVVFTIIIDGYPIDHPFQETVNGIKFIYYPLVRHNKTEVISAFLLETISLSDNMIFWVNYFPGSFMAKAVKISFPKSVLIQVVHDIPWLAICKGNPELYASYINDHSSVKSNAMVKNINYITIDMLVTFRMASYIITLCQDAFKLITNIYNIPEKKVKLIPNGLCDTYNKLDKKEILRYRKYLNLPIEKKIIVSTGRLSISKGTDRIIQLMLELYNQNLLSQWHLLHIGSDDVRSWFPTKLFPYVTHLGPFPQKKVIRLLSISDVGIIASRHEQCSYSGIEMLMCNLPILYCSNTFGVENMFQEVGIKSELWISFLKEVLVSCNQDSRYRKKFLQSYAFHVMKFQYDNLLDTIKRDLL